MTTIAHYAASSGMQPYEVAAFLNLGLGYSDQDELSAEDLAMLSIPTDITDRLDEWGIDYLFDTDGVSVGDSHVEMDNDDYVVKTGDDIVAITSDTDKAAALLAFPLARRAWALGYAGDFDVTVRGGEMGMRLSYGSSDVTVSAGVGEVDAFTVVEHDLLSNSVVMDDLEAVLASTELAYSEPLEAWQALCGSDAFDRDRWESIVEFFNEDVRFDHGDRFTKVESYITDGVALVEDGDSSSPVHVIDVETVSDATFWSASDVAAAVLFTIS